MLSGDILGAFQGKIGQTEEGIMTELEGSAACVAGLSQE